MLDGQISAVVPPWRASLHNLPMAVGKNLPHHSAMADWYRVLYSKICERYMKAIGLWLLDLAIAVLFVTAVKWGPVSRKWCNQRVCESKIYILRSLWIKEKDPMINSFCTYILEVINISEDLMYVVIKIFLKCSFQVLSNKCDMSTLYIDC